MYNAVEAWVTGNNNSSMQSLSIFVVLNCLVVILEYFMEFGTSFSKLKIMRTAITYSTKKC